MEPRANGQTGRLRYTVCCQRQDYRNVLQCEVGKPAAAIHAGWDSNWASQRARRECSPAEIFEENVLGTGGIACT